MRRHATHACMLNPASKASLDQALSTPIGMYVLADVCVLVCARHRRQSAMQRPCALGRVCQLQQRNPFESHVAH